LKTALLLISFAALACAQDSKSAEVRRLGSVTWDLDSHKLIWVVQKGTAHNGKFSPVAEDRYEITPDDAVMSYLDEKRAFTEDEATSLHHLLDVLSMYCAESTAWWDDGQGVPIDSSGKPAGPGKKPEKQDKSSKPHRVEAPERQTPKSTVRDGDLIARAQ
jgi:hypothetical protein